MYVMFLNLIKGNISINTKYIYIDIDFGDPVYKIHLQRSEGLKLYRFCGMTRVHCSHKGMDMISNNTQVDCGV